jgi:hypothetical protein
LEDERITLYARTTGRTGPAANEINELINN